MGKQSARLYYDGKDHKDIYFYERYHMAMVKEGEIIWSKMLDDCLILFRDNFIVIITKKDAVVFKNFDNVFRYYHSQFHTGNSKKTGDGKSVFSNFRRLHNRL